MSRFVYGKIFRGVEIGECILRLSNDDIAMGTGYDGTMVLRYGTQSRYNTVTFEHQYYSTIDYSTLVLVQYNGWVLVLLQPYPRTHVLIARGGGE